MSAPAARPKPLRRKRSLLLLALFIVVYAVASLGEFARHMDVSDDTIWYYYVGSGVVDRSAFAREHEFLPALQPLAEDDMTWKRMTLRAGYAGNYLLPTFVCFHAGHVLAQFLAAPAQYTEFLAAALYYGYLAALVLGLLIAALAFLPARYDMQQACVVAVVAMAALAMLPVDGAIGVLASPPLRFKDLLAVPYGLARILLDPHHAIGPFGAMARNQIIFLALGLFALRWSGRYVLSYVFMIVLLLVHQSMAFLLLVPLLAVDALVRPALFAQPRFLAAAGTSVLLALLREAHWAGLGRAALFIGVGVALLALAATLGALLFGRYRVLLARWRTRFDALRSRIAGRGDIALDLTGMTLVLIAVVAAALVGNHIAEPYSRDYFWSILPGRFFALLRPMYLLAAAWLLVRYLSARPRLGLAPRAWSGIGVAALAAVVALDLASAPRLSAAKARVSAGVEALDAALVRSDGSFRTSDESRFYYALLKSRVTAEDYLRRMWPAAR